MSLPEKQPGVVQVVWTKGQLNRVEKDEGAGFRGVFYEGTISEEPGSFVSLCRWSSVDAAKKSQSGAPSSRSDQSSPIIAHYQMYDPTPLDPKPECVETVTFKIRPDVSFTTFYTEWSPALKHVSAFKGCPYVALGQGIEDQRAVLQIQPWQTLDDHMVGFKEAPNVGDVMAKLSPVVEKYVEGGWKGMKGLHVMLTN